MNVSGPFGLIGRLGLSHLVVPRIEDSCRQISAAYWQLQTLAALCPGLARELQREGAAPMAAAVSMMGLRAGREVETAAKAGWIAERPEPGELGEDWWDGALPLEMAEALVDELTTIVHLILDSRDFAPLDWDAGLLQSAGELLKAAGALRRAVDRKISS